MQINGLGVIVRTSTQSEGSTSSSSVFIPGTQILNEKGDKTIVKF